VRPRRKDAAGPASGDRKVLMMPDQYSPCPCGSGKKFKWCCQPIYAGINRAWDQEANGQHEAALRLIEEVTREHPGNPEAWGQYARLLYAHGRLEEAEAALQKGLDINPNYPYGLLLRAMFRFHEGEYGGALLLARRAAEAYDPEAHSYLGEVYSLIFDCEMKMNRPVGARAALRLVLHYLPGEEETRQSFEVIFGPTSRLPESARKEYRFLAPPADMPALARSAWDRALGEASNLRLADLVRLFEPLAQQAPSNAAAWYNLGLSRAWLGENAAAVEALEHYLDLEADEARAAQAATLMEVLRCGAGMEDEADYHEYSLVLGIRNPEPVGNLLREWSQAGRLHPIQSQLENTFTALLLELTTASLITVGAPAAEGGKLAGYVVIAGPLFQYTSPRQEPFGRVRDEIRQRLSLGLGEMQERRLPIQLHDVVADALWFPVVQREDNAQRVQEHIRKYFEETWLHQPRRALSGNTPVDAAGHTRLRKKLAGVIQFLQDCGRNTPVGQYDFNRLRRVLGMGAAPAAGAPAAAPAPGAAADIASMGTAELAGLDLPSLSPEQLEQAYQAALKLDAEELATHFARALVARPPQPERPDRFPWYAYLTQRALKAGDTAAALDLVNEGEKTDCEQNDGRRRNDYELRRGQVHIKRGELDAAEDVFRRLIERVPSNLKYRGAAAEAMLSARQGARALRFAEEGLAAASAANDRDSEQYLMELVEAARKQV
jgi:tetratricopeptide (TPR) repeat protein